MKLRILAAALIAAPAFVAVPASADYIGAGPNRNSDGKCWKDTGGPRDGRYGFWTDCPKKTAAATASAECAVGQLAWEKQHVGLQYFDFCRK